MGRWGAGFVVFGVKVNDHLIVKIKDFSDFLTEFMHLAEEAEIRLED